MNKTMSDNDLEPIEDIREKLEEYEEKYPTAEVTNVEGGDVTVTNDAEEIAEAQANDAFASPDHRPDDMDKRKGPATEEDKDEDDGSA